MTTKRSQSPYDLCIFEYSDGRYCGLPSVPSLNGFCRAHGKPQALPPSPEYNEALIFEPFKSDPPSEAEVHSVLAQVLRAVACNRISTRRAATLGYLGQLLLTSKGSKEAREGMNNLSRLLLKTVDLTYSPKYPDSPLRPGKPLSPAKPST